MKNPLRNITFQKKGMLSLVLLSLASVAFSQPFITTWVTDDTEITIPTLASSGTYNYDITWTNLTNAGVGDGSATGQTGDYTITGLTDGDTIQVEISGDFPHFYMAYGAERLKLLTIEQWGTIVWTSMASAFNGCVSLTYNAIDNPDLSNVTDMSGMFGDASSFNGGIGSWDVSNVTTMSGMFWRAISFNSAIGNWDVSNVEDMSQMFGRASGFDQDISNWDVSSVRLMHRMFWNATNFNNGGVPLSWSEGTGTFNVANMKEMFAFADNFNQDIGNWDVSNVRDMYQMFASADNFNQDIGTWNVSKVEKMVGIFQSAESFNQPIGNWDVSKLESMQNLFRGATSFNQDISSWDVSSVKSMTYMFAAASNFNQDLSSWNVQNVVDLSSMFSAASSFNGDIGSWNVSNVTDMRSMFQFASAFNQDISSWDVSSVLYMEGMFRNASSFNNGGEPLSWNSGTGTSNVIITSNMFENAILFNQSINTWGMGSVTNMTGMFKNATAYNQDMSNWDVSSVTNMRQMFESATSFDQDISDWDVSNVSDMIRMFSGATSYNNGGVTLDWSSTTSLTSVGGMFTSASSFNQDISSWDISNVTALNDFFENASSFNNGGVPLTWTDGTANVTTMLDMFNGATAFNQDISDWNVSSLTNMLRMFSGASSFNQDISSWDVSNVSDMRVLFRQATSFNQSLADWDISSVTNMVDMLDETNLSFTNYDSTLIGWNTLDAGETQIPTGITLGAEGLEYTNSGEPSRTNLIDTHGWTITGDMLVSSSTPEISVYAGSDNNAQSITSGQSAAIDLGSAEVGNDLTQTFAIENTGDSDLTISSILSSEASYTVTSSISFVAAGATETFTVTLSSASEGTFTADITITSDDADEGTFVFPVSGEITAVATAPEITVYAGSDNTAPFITNGQSTTIDLGSAEVGNDLTQTFAIENTGDSDLTIISLTSSSPSYSVSNTFATVAVGSLETFTITLSGAEEGVFTSEISIENNDSDENPFSFNVTAEINAAPLIPQIEIYEGLTNEGVLIMERFAIDMGVTTQGVDLEKDFTIANSGNTDLIISSITSANPSFTVTSDLTNIAAGGIGNFFVTMDASEGGVQSTEIVINSNDPEITSFSFKLSGEITFEEIDVIDQNTGENIHSDGQVDLGDTQVGNPILKSYLLTNPSSTETIVFTSVSINDPAFEIINLPPSIAPASSDTLIVQLNANTSGTFSGLLLLESNFATYELMLVGEVISRNNTIRVFNVITPNGDGIHDYLKIERIEEHPDNQVFIFTKSGQLIYEATGYNNQEIKFEGVPNRGGKGTLQAGTYYYVIDLLDDKKESGFIQLFKN